MELMIDFECPACRQLLARPLADIALGRRARCAGCGTATELTAYGLIEFQKRLHLACATPPSSAASPQPNEE